LPENYEIAGVLTGTNQTIDGFYSVKGR